MIIVNKLILIMLKYISISFRGYILCYTNKSKADLINIL